MKKILVTGGAGYIGSHTIVDLIENGFDIISIDNFSNSDASSLQGIKKITGKEITNYECDLSNIDDVRKVLSEHEDIFGIIHFAAYKYVGESTEKPLEYYNNNLSSLINILQIQKEFNIPNFVFSSSCSVYGNPDHLPVTEHTAIQEAESPYAMTKQMGEAIIRDIAKVSSQFNYLILRYFNPAGYHSSRYLKENSPKEIETLVPIIQEVHDGKREKLVIFGGDYPTRDGTCIRDYIHIMDLANAHTKCLQFLIKSDKKPTFEVFNVGTGKGITVLEMVHAIEKVTGQPLTHDIGPRRAGDIVAVYSDYSRAKTQLNWEPKYNIEDIFKSII